VEDDLLRNALLEAKQLGHKVRSIPTVVFSSEEVATLKCQAGLMFS
jgi:hypothetical protein